jgi:hypothetical protein
VSGFLTIHRLCELEEEEEEEEGWNEEAGVEARVSPVNICGFAAIIVIGEITTKQSGSKN